MSSSAYRPDIDGLRAVAVSLVFVNHAFPERLPSGFIGVDVFFVISGFVVTLSILSGGYGSGGRGILEFWRRRILRIIPALVLFLCLTSIAYAAFFALNTNVQFISALRTGIAALIGASNLYLISIGNDYFLADSSTNVFTHTWSLGVEEQFYLVFAPIAFVLLGMKRKNLLPLLLALLSIVSFGAFVWLSGHHPVSTYYGLHTRFWELGVGALLAVVMSRGGIGKNSLHWIAMLGMLLVLVSSFLPRDIGGFGLPIIGGVLGTGLLILFGATQSSPLHRVLSWRPVVFVGLISYGLYLWHWPILVFIRWNIGMTLGSFCVAVLCAAALAWFSYRFVEVPIRRVKAPLGARVLPVAGAGIAGVSAVALSLSANQGAVYAGRPIQEADWLPKLDVAYGPDGQITGDDCLLTRGDPVPRQVPEKCNIPAQKFPEAKKLLLIGDSHAYSQFGLLAEVGQTPNWSGMTLVHDGCAWHMPEGSLSDSCQKYLGELPNLIRETVSDGDFVLVSVYFDLEATELDLAADRLAAANAAANEVGARLVIELPHLRSETSAIHCRKEWFRLRYEGCTRSIESMQDYRAKTVANLRSFAAARAIPPLLWDPLPNLCANGRCAAVKDAEPVLRDGNHLSAIASRRLAEPLLRSLTSSPES